MNKLIIALAIAVLTMPAFGQLEVPNPVPNDTVTGTTLNKLVKRNTTASATSVIITAITDKVGAEGVCADACGTSGKAAIISIGIGSVIIDNATTPNDYVTISPTVAGDGHDFGATCPTDGSQVVGKIFGAGGTAGTYTVDFQRGLCVASSTAPLCSLIGSSDTLSAPGTFATVCPIPSTAISGVGQILEIRVHGVYTSGTTAPNFALQVNAGGTAGLCVSASGMTVGASLTNVAWDVACYVQIVTTGNPGTAIPWGLEEAANASTNASVNRLLCNASPCTASTDSFITASTQNVSVQETAVFQTSETLTLQTMIVRAY